MNTTIYPKNLKAAQAFTYSHIENNSQYNHVLHKMLDAVADQTDEGKMITRSWLGWMGRTNVCDNLAMSWASAAAFERSIDCDEIDFYHEFKFLLSLWNKIKETQPEMELDEERFYAKAKEFAKSTGIKNIVEKSSLPHDTITFA